MLMKPTTYDGSTSWAQYERQFLMIAELNNSDQAFKTSALTGSLRGAALNALTSLSDVDAKDLNKLSVVLKLQFEDEHMAKLYFTKFNSRRQGRDEDLATLGHDIERLIRQALPDCAPHTRDQLACARFLDAISSPSLRQTLKLAAPTTLRQALIKGLEIETITKEEFGTGKVRQLAATRPQQETWAPRKRPASPRRDLPPEAPLER